MKSIIKKLTYISIILLIFTSLYMDLQKNINKNVTTTYHQLNVREIKVKHGDTILSIIEELNESSIHKMNIDKIMEDFKQLNPLLEGLELEEGKIYSFPIYN